MLETQSLATSGHNWGNAVIDGSTLVFMVDGKPAFRIPLPDVTQVCFVQSICNWTLVTFNIDTSCCSQSSASLFHVGGAREVWLMPAGFEFGERR